MDSVSATSSPSAVAIRTPQSNVIASAIDDSASLQTAQTAIDTPASTTAFSQNASQFQQLSSIVLDTSGTYTEDEQANAYSSLYAMGVNGQLRGMDSDNQKVLNQVLSGSAVAVKAQEIQQRDFATVTAAAANGDSPAEAKLKFVAGLSDQDQRTYFNVAQNPFTPSGSREYADFDSYRNQLVANVKNELSEYAGKSGVDFKTALNGLDSAQAGTSWSTQILALFGPASSSRSNSAQSSNTSTAKTSVPDVYQPGNMFSTQA